MRARLNLNTYYYNSTIRKVELKHLPFSLNYPQDELKHVLSSLNYPQDERKYISLSFNPFATAGSTNDR